MLESILRALIHDGTLIVWRKRREPLIVGAGDPLVVVRLTDTRAEWELATNPDLALGELYMDERLVIERGDIAQLLDLLLANLSRSKATRWRRIAGKLRRATRVFHQWNTAAHSRRNVAHHYDLSERLYERFLDSDRQYSCAYFRSGVETLDDAQAAKRRHITAKLYLDRRGLSVLDVGCGWGGLALELANRYGARVTGVTLSKEQLGVAQTRAKKAGLADQCEFALQDYRKVRGRFDRIVSVGMFEHVGVRYYNAFFRTVARLLDDDGVMLLHFIGRLDGPGATNPWIAKYIFPGGYVPALSEVLPAIERSGLIVTDIEVLRLHYAETLKAWRARFQAHRSEIAKLYDERFCRMWEFYLAGAEMAFRHEKQCVFQIQIAKRLDALPITRDYMLAEEQHAQPDRAVAATSRAA